MGWGSVVGSVAGSLIGDAVNGHKADDAAYQSYKNQKEFAQNGIRWKVADAKAAGIHPLAALGTMPTTYTPTEIGGSQLDLGAMGQDLGRAWDATRTKEERAQHMGAAAAELAAKQKIRDQQDLTRAQLENDKIKMETELLKSQIARNIQAWNPGFPSNATSGGVPSYGGPGYVVKPAEITQHGKNPAVTAGVNPGFSDFRIGGENVGFNIQLPSAQTGSEAFESMGEILSPITVGTHWALQGADAAYNYFRNWKKPTRSINTNPRYRRY